MAELTTEQKVVIVGILVPAFNRKRGKVFRLAEDHETLEKRCRCDIVLAAEDGEVARLEHTRANVDDERYRGKPSRVWRVVELIDRHLRARTKVLPGTLIALGFQHPPSHRLDQARVAALLAPFIEEKAQRAEAIRLAVSPTTSSTGPLEPVRRWVAELEIIPVPETRGHFFLPYQRLGFPDDEDQIREAVSRKTARYGAGNRDTVLLIEFDKQPAHYTSVHAICDEVHRLKPPFREVWVVNNCQNEKQCWCVWPSGQASEWGTP